MFIVLTQLGDLSVPIGINVDNVVSVRPISNTDPSRGCSVRTTAGTIVEVREHFDQLMLRPELNRHG